MFDSEAFLQTLEWGELVIVEPQDFEVGEVIEID